MADTVRTITIDLNKRCTLCGKRGATPRGWCLKCITKNLDKLIGKVRRA